MLRIVCIVLSLAAAPGCVLAQDWELTSAPITNWSAVASSANGTILFGAAFNGGGIYRSTNSGFTWTRTSAPSIGWGSVACSADGTKLVAWGGSGNPPDFGTIYTSTDLGETWTPRYNLTNSWQTVASSADGSVLVTAGRDVYSSVDSGTTWRTTSAPSDFWYFVSAASSADGTRLTAVASRGNLTLARIYTSENSGISWSQVGSPNATEGIIVSSADGRKLVLAEHRTGIHISNDFGTNWFDTSAPYFNAWTGIASSADGVRLVAAATGEPDLDTGSIYMSTDSGISWFQSSAPAITWRAVASSADGTKLVAAASRGGIYVWHSSSAPVLSIVRLDGSVALRWSASSSNFVLEEKSDLTTTNWTSSRTRLS